MFFRTLPASCLLHPIGQSKLADPRREGAEIDPIQRTTNTDKKRTVGQIKSEINLEGNKTKTSW